MLLRR